ncbi:alpha/beta hydrolase [Dietzia sp.]|uniref:alpha/beta hydrolase n=1 Tax=Dietzia sp. TaxID=1871616 RepID=UPI002FDB36C2
MKTSAIRKAAFATATVASASSLLLAGGGAQAFAADMEKARETVDAPVATQGASPEALATNAAGTLGGINPDQLSQILGSSGDPAFAGSTIMGSADALGFSPDLFAGDSPLPPAPDPSIKETKVLKKTVTNGRYEQWEIAYAPMQRVITIEIYRAPGGNAAPNLYLLDGVGSERPSGFMVWGAKKQFENENVNLVIPTGGQASMWADWEKQDPKLGISKWETFITEDLPKLISGDEIALKQNGKNGIGGISMGAASAYSLAVRHPDKYQGVFGVSGCYTTDDFGQILTRYTVESRGANVNNMWGTPGNENWQAHDAISQAEKLRGKALYLSSATGAAKEGEFEAYDQNIGNFVVGAALEQASNVCTNRMHEKLDTLGIEHRFDQLPAGLHNWSLFTPQIPVAWNTIKGALGA